MDKLARRPQWAWRGAIGAVVLLALALRFWHLDHAHLSSWDEGYHALVAKNLLRHPFTPTLIDKPYLRPAVANWPMAHIWLHKPILPFWQMAISLWLFGLTTFAARLPSAILSSASVYVTWLIGVRLLDRPAALVGALLQAVSAASVLQVQGYLFADHVDVALVFWTELSIWQLARAVHSGNRRDYIGCGVLTGMAVLSKSAVGLVAPAVAVGLGLLLITKRINGCPGFRNLLALGTSLIATLLPWTLWCCFRFRAEFLYENAYVFRHLSEGVEGWSAPWYRAAWTYLLFLLGPVYMPALVALGAAAWFVVRGLNTRLSVLVLWASTVIGLNLIAHTKTPAAMISALPAMFLLVGWMVSQGIGTNAALRNLCVGVALASLLFPIASQAWLNLYPNPGEFGSHPMQEARVLTYEAGVILIGWLALQKATGPFALISRSVAVISRGVIGVGLALAIGIGVRQSAWASSLNVNNNSLAEVAAVARVALPSNAVLLVDEDQSGDWLNLAFACDKTCYPLQGFGKKIGADMTHSPLVVIGSVSARLRAAGADPYLVSKKDWQFRPIANCPIDGERVYVAP